VARARRKRSTTGGSPVLRAFDEVTFGSERTLNLRDRLPSEADALRRANGWLRERQVMGANEVLVITGRGLGSDNGVGVIKAGVLRLLPTLRRQGVVTTWREHTPGSFIVQLAPLRALFEAPRRKRQAVAAAPAPESLEGLSSDTRDLLRAVAMRSLEVLGIRGVEPFIKDEMLRYFALFAATAPDSFDREEWLRKALRRALETSD
jgi:hypothetical protein